MRGALAMEHTIEIWRACGVGFVACMLAFGLGGLWGKKIGWDHARDFYNGKQRR